VPKRKNLQKYTKNLPFRQSGIQIKTPRNDEVFFKIECIKPWVGLLGETRGR